MKQQNWKLLFKIINEKYKHPTTIILKPGPQSHSADLYLIHTVKEGNANIRFIVLAIQAKNYSTTTSFNVSTLQKEIKKTQLLLKYTKGKFNIDLIFLICITNLQQGGEFKRIFERKSDFLYLPLSKTNELNNKNINDLQKEIQKHKKYFKKCFVNDEILKFSPNCIVIKKKKKKKKKKNKDQKNEEYEKMLTIPEKMNLIFLHPNQLKSFIGEKCYNALNDLKKSKKTITRIFTPIKVKPKKKKKKWE
ncbi:hypothetical protein M0812_19334 [Anaeramoeba flamelloides]|uniref:Uncharacterized protein n=1 Tax=Anaeramoeba flamelloides TaxID=1746091 RepID=A0AAV7Z3Q7_9EUKA|nr:hypothetical protein M0812_19334 [Anaeramoeba flamelloides]